MERYDGKSISKGIAAGRLSFHIKTGSGPERHAISDIEAELARYEAARDETVAELSELQKKAEDALGTDEAAIFEAYIMMVTDINFEASVRYNIVSQSVNAEYAVACAGETFIGMLEEDDSEYFRERIADIGDVTGRLIKALSGMDRSCTLCEEPFIAAAAEFTPGDIMQMDRDKLVAVVTEFGSAASHTAILLGTMGIPAVSGIPVCPEWDKMTAVIDGENGRVYLNPDEKIMSLIRERLEAQRESEAKLAAIRDKAAVTRSGRKIGIYANISDVPDVGAAVESGAEGIGLFRSEFLYLERNDYPTEDELFEAYRAVAQFMGKKRVVIRTLDIGEDKITDYLIPHSGINPAMGMKGIRVCLENPGILITPLKAIYRAGIYGNLAVMYPFITSVKELEEAKELTETAKKELAAEGRPFRDMEQGVMIETPAAALISGELAKMVDFFSIGTNDLTQYALAADRDNSAMDKYYDPKHPAVMQLIKMAVDNGHAAGCRVSVCGELAADISAVSMLAEMGVDELSVSPASVLPVKKAVLDCDA